MTPIPAMPAAVPPQVRTLPLTSDEKLMAAAQKLEATFLSEMLKSAGFDAARGAFGGGEGEERRGEERRVLHHFCAMRRPKIWFLLAGLDLPNHFSTQ